MDHLRDIVASIVEAHNTNFPLVYLLLYVSLILVLIGFVIYLSYTRCCRYAINRVIATSVRVEDSANSIQTLANRTNVIMDSAVNAFGGIAKIAMVAVCISIARSIFNAMVKKEEIEDEHFWNDFDVFVTKHPIPSESKEFLNFQPKSADKVKEYQLQKFKHARHHEVDWILTTFDAIAMILMVPILVKYGRDSGMYVYTHFTKALSYMIRLTGVFQLISNIFVSDDNAQKANNISDKVVESTKKIADRAATVIEQTNIPCSHKTIATLANGKKTVIACTTQIHCMKKYCELHQLTNKSPGEIAALKADYDAYVAYCKDLAGDHSHAQSVVSQLDDGIGLGIQLQGKDGVDDLELEQLQVDPSTHKSLKQYFQKFNAKYDYDELHSLVAGKLKWLFVAVMLVFVLVILMWWQRSRKVLAVPSAPIVVNVPLIAEVSKPFDRPIPIKRILPKNIDVKEFNAATIVVAAIFSELKHLEKVKTVEVANAYFAGDPKYKNLLDHSSITEKPTKESAVLNGAAIAFTAWITSTFLNLIYNPGEIVIRMPCCPDEDVHADLALQILELREKLKLQTIQVKERKRANRAKAQNPGYAPGHGKKTPYVPSTSTSGQDIDLINDYPDHYNRDDNSDTRSAYADSQHDDFEDDPTMTYTDHFGDEVDPKYAVPIHSTVRYGEKPSTRYSEAQLQEAFNKRMALYEANKKTIIQNPDNYKQKDHIDRRIKCNTPDCSAKISPKATLCNKCLALKNNWTKKCSTVGCDRLIENKFDICFRCFSKQKDRAVKATTKKIAKKVTIELPVIAPVSKESTNNLIKAVRFNYTDSLSSKKFTLVDNVPQENTEEHKQSLIDYVGEFKEFKMSGSSQYKVGQVAKALCWIEITYPSGNLAPAATDPPQVILSTQSLNCSLVRGRLFISEHISDVYKKVANINTVATYTLWFHDGSHFVIPDFSVFEVCANDELSADVNKVFRGDAQARSKLTSYNKLHKPVVGDRVDLVCLSGRPTMEDSMLSISHGFITKINDNDTIVYTASSDFGNCSGLIIHPSTGGVCGFHNFGSAIGNGFISIEPIAKKYSWNF